MADNLDTFTKDELLDEADSLGVDVKSTDTKAEIISKIRAETDAAPDPTATSGEAPAQQAQVEVVNPNKVVNNFNARSDDDAYQGAFVDVVGGEHQGVFGHYVDTVEWDTEGDGYPTKVLVKSRDADAELLIVDYADVRNSARAGGR